MKNLCCLLLILVCFPGLAFANETVLQGTVYDETNQPLAYVNIGISGTALGTVSAEDGTFSLYLPDQVNATDTVIFSTLGYATQAFSAQGLLAACQDKPLEIVLPAITLDLPAATVRPAFDHYTTKGNNNTNANMTVQFSISKQPNQNLGAEIGHKFNFRKTVHLERFRFFISANNFDSVKFRINIRSLENGRPAIPINKENIIVEVTDRQKGWIEVDLSPYQITVSEDIAVGVEWIDHSAKGTALSLPITVPSIGAVHYYHYGSQGEWKKFPMMSGCMELEVAY